MNVELKAMLVVLFKLFALGKDLVNKAGVLQDVADLEALGMSIAPVISNFADLQAEVEALSTPANLADILEFIAAQFAGVDSDAKAQAILNASIKLVGDMTVDAVQLVNAIKA